MPATYRLCDSGVWRPTSPGLRSNKPRSVEYMRDLGRRGGLKSGETRRVRRILTEYAAQKGTGVPLDILDPTEIWPESILKRESRAGGSHDTDWRCRKCHHFNSIKSRACSKCKTPGPVNGRLTRAALRERAPPAPGTTAENPGGSFDNPFDLKSENGTNAPKA